MERVDSEDEIQSASWSFDESKFNKESTSEGDEDSGQDLQQAGGMEL